MKRSALAVIMLLAWLTSCTPTSTFESQIRFAAPTARDVAATPAPAEAASASSVSTLPFMKGVAYTSWRRDGYSSRQSDTTLSQVIKPIGADWISLLVTCYQDKLTSTRIQCKTDASTPTDDALTHAIQDAHRLGIRVMLKPHVDLGDDPTHWRGQIGFGGNAAAWQRWFDSYTDFIVHYAALAQKAGADYFAVGTELAGTSRHADQWRAVVKAVRAAYRGPLIYAANYGEEVNITWWDALDAIGIDAYYPLTQSKRPTLAQLKAAWAPIVSRLGQLSKKWDRPIVLTEIGYRSLDGANREPCNYQIAGLLDLEEQADCYEAVFEAFAGQAWWRGMFWWNWTTDPAQGGPRDTDYTAHDKPAEAVLQKYYSAVW